MALCGLIKNHSASAINSACSKALKAGTYRFKDLRRLIGEQSEQQVFSFADDHPLIRDLTVYSNFAIQRAEPTRIESEIIGSRGGFRIAEGGSSHRTLHNERRLPHGTLHKGHAFPLLWQE